MHSINFKGAAQLSCFACRRTKLQLSQRVFQRMLTIMPMAACAKMIGSPMGICPARVKKLQISTNICGKKMKESGYQFKWTFEEALADWYEDNKGQYLE